MRAVSQSMYGSRQSWWNEHIQPKPLNDSQLILAYPVFAGGGLSTDKVTYVPITISRSRAYNILNKFTLACLASKRTENLIEMTSLLFPVE